ncbi:hypothetical protein [Inquilinus sp. CA228]
MIPVVAVTFGTIAVLLWSSGLGFTLVVGGATISATVLMVTLP